MPILSISTLTQRRKQGKPTSRKPLLDDLMMKNGGANFFMLVDGSPGPALYPNIKP